MCWQTGQSTNAWVWVLLIIFVLIFLFVVYQASLQNQPILGAAGAARANPVLGSAAMYMSNGVGATNAPTTGVFARVAHAAPAVTTPVNVLVNGSVVLSNVTYGTVSDYLPLPPNTNITVQLQTNGAIALTQQILTPSLLPNQPQLVTIAAVNSNAPANASPVSLLTYNDMVIPTNTGARFYHLNSAAPPVTLYANGMPLFNTAYTESLSGLVPAGTYNITVTPQNTNNVIYATTATINQNQVLSVFAEGTSVASLKVVTKYSNV